MQFSIASCNVCCSVSFNLLSSAVRIQLRVEYFSHIFRTLAIHSKVMLTFKILEADSEGRQELSNLSKMNATQLSLQL